MLVKGEPGILVTFWSKSRYTCFEAKYFYYLRDGKSQLAPSAKLSAGTDKQLTVDKIVLYDAQYNEVKGRFTEKCIVAWLGFPDFGLFIENDLNSKTLSYDT